MKRRAVYSIIAIAIVIMVIIAGFYLLFQPRKSIPKDKSTKPYFYEIPEDIWPQYRRTVMHDGASHSNASLKGSLTETWVTYDINEEYYSASKSSPAVDLDMVYIGADTGKLHAFWRDNGTEAWWFETRYSTNGIHGSPAFDSEKVYVGAYDGRLYALNKSNGELIWKSKLGDYIGSSPCLYNGVAYIGVEMSKPAGYLVGCNMTNGKEVFRSAEFGSHPHSTPSVDPTRNFIYIGANDNKVYCYNLTSKTEVWNYSTDKDVKSTPCIAGDILFITSWDYRVYALDLDTGEEYITFKTGMRSMSSPAINTDGNRVFVGSHDGYIYCLNARDFSEHWKFKTGARILSSPTLVERDRSVLCGSNDGKVYFLDTGTGSVRNILDFGIGVTSVPVVVQNQLYVFDNEGLLHRFDAV